MSVDPAMPTDEPLAAAEAEVERVGDVDEGQFGAATDAEALRALEREPSSPPAPPT